MNKKKQIKQIEKRIQEIPEKSQYIFYQNPKNFCKLKLERINPDHIGLIWGLRNSKQRKTKGKNWGRVAKVYFGGLIFAFKTDLQRFIDIIANYGVYVLNNYDVVLAGYYIGFSLLFLAIVLNIPVIEGWVQWKLAVS